MQNISDLTLVSSMVTSINCVLSAWLFFCHNLRNPLQAAVNIKSCKSYAQFRVVRALRAPIALKSPEQPPQPSRGPGPHFRAITPCSRDAVGCCSPAPHGPAQPLSLLSWTVIKCWPELTGVGSSVALPDVPRDVQVPCLSDF